MVTLYDVIHQTCLYKGFGQVVSQQIVFDGQTWSIQDGLTIEKTKDLKMLLHFQPGRQSQGYVYSEFGEVKVPIYTKLLRIEPKQIEVAYCLADENFHFRLTLD